MIYIENNLEKQDVFIPRNDGSTCYVSPYDKGYQDGYQDGIDDCGDCPIQQKEVVLTATTETISPDQGYAGMDSVFVDARQLALEKYNDGYHEGEEDGAEEQKSKLETVTFDRNGEYTREDGWSAVTVDVPKDIELGTLVDTPPRISDLTYDTYINTFDPQQASVDGWGRVEIGLEFIINDAKNQQKALMTGTTFTQNGLYRREDGWNEVIVEVPQTGTSCNLESKTETVTANTQTILPSSGYDGMSEVVVDATDYGQDKYDEGFADGQASVPPCPPCPEIESGVTYGIGSGFTGATVIPSSGYDGMAEVTITDNGYGQEKYDEGHGDGYNEGFSDGQTDILSGMTDTTITQNGIYSNPSGWSGVTVAVPQTGSSCNLQQKAITLESGDTSPWAVTPDAGYDGMSGVTITDNGYGQEKYDEGYEEGYQDGSIVSCNLQEKSVTLTATTECIYPDTTGYENYLGFESPSWAVKNLIDTGIYPTQTSTARIKYKGRGVRSDRIVGSIDGYQGCNDNSDYRVFDAIGLTVDVGSARRTTSITSITQTDVIYDITFGNAYVYDNISETLLLSHALTRTVNTGFTYTVDVGSFWLKELTIEDNGVTLFSGTPREENGVAGLYDSVSNSFLTLFSGSTGSTVIHAEPLGYTGLASVCIDATGLVNAKCQECYNEGYNEGYKDAEDEIFKRKDYLSFEATENGGIMFLYDGPDRTGTDLLSVEYSKNGGAWSSITAIAGYNVMDSSQHFIFTPQISVNAGDTVKIRANNDSYEYHHFWVTPCYVYGNIMSLLYGSNYTGETEFKSGTTKVFQELFYVFNEENKVLSHDIYELVLPATSLVAYCYNSMFKACTSLTRTPKLPSTGLVSNCYLEMFMYCTSLTTAPDLNAGSLSPYAVYQRMFSGCTNLNYVKCLATSGLPDWPNYSPTNGWLTNVAANGTFIKHPDAVWPTGNSGIPSGWTVQNNQ